VSGSFKDGTIEDAIEFAYWQFDSTDLSKKVPSRDAFKITVRNLISVRGLVDSLAPIPMRLTCPECGELHIDEGEFATKPHHTHSCQHCGLTWRPAVVATVGVRFLPGFKSP
jgi:hypothetical protein